MKSQTYIRSVLISGLILLALLLFACEETTNDPESEDGLLLVKISDDPFPAEFIAEANIVINKIEVRQTDTETSPFLTVSEDSNSFNLLELRNGITASLPEVDLPVGDYDLIRLYVAEASVVLDNGQDYELTVPSGAQTGIKLFIAPDIEVRGGLTSELLIDFDVSKSFRVMGNPDSPAGINGFKFQPVIRAVNLSQAGRITGSVSDTASVSIADAQVWVEQDSVISFTFSDSLGQYALIGIPAGTYSLGAYKMSYDTTWVSNVEVVAGNATQQSIELTQ